VSNCLPQVGLFHAALGCTRVTEHWYETRDGDPFVCALYDRHYSRRHYKDGRKPKLFVGPGEKLVLVSTDGDAVFIWRKFIDDSGQRGVNCAAFRNESPILSSILIREAVEVAWHRWPNERLYTYVNARAVHGDGACFKHAGWRRCGRTKGRLVILERVPD